MDGVSCVRGRQHHGPHLHAAGPGGNPMTKAISEQALEAAIVADLTQTHYVQRPPSAFDKALCLDPGPLIDFVQATQPREWLKFVEQHRADARDAFLKRVAEAVEQDGTVTVLRQGVKATGCRFRLA